MHTGGAGSSKAGQLQELTPPPADSLSRLGGVNLLKRLERDGAKAGSKTAQGGASAGTKAAPMPQAALSASTPPELSLDAGFPRESHQQRH